ncbi:MAG: hypothetical protein K2W79_06055, partial [Hydrotalea flava]|nr:hypothetical protein [Hydrotalea flava]
TPHSCASNLYFLQSHILGLLGYKYNHSDVQAQEANTLFHASFLRQQPAFFTISHTWTIRGMEW